MDSSVMIKTAPPPTPQESISNTPGQRSPVMERKALARGYEIYEGPGSVKTSPFIRVIHDVVGLWEMPEERGRAGVDKPLKDPPCPVFEWMDHVLWNVRLASYREKSVLATASARSVLRELSLFASANAIHTGRLCIALDIPLVVLTRSDVNPHNMFLSDIDSASPVMKLGDLGNHM